MLYSQPVQRDGESLPSPARARGRGKSEHHKAACRVECAGAFGESRRRRIVSQKINRPRSDSRARVKRRGKSPPLQRRPLKARQTRPGASPNRRRGAVRADDGISAGRALEPAGDGGPRARLRARAARLLPDGEGRPGSRGPRRPRGGAGASPAVLAVGQPPAGPRSSRDVPEAFEPSGERSGGPFRGSTPSVRASFSSLATLGQEKLSQRRELGRATGPEQTRVATDGG